MVKAKEIEARDFEIRRLKMRTQGTTGHLRPSTLGSRDERAWGHWIGSVTFVCLGEESLG